MMNDAFIREIREGAGKPQIVTVGDTEHLLVPASWTEIEKPNPTIEPLKVGTLSGLVDYVKTVASVDEAGPVIVHIESPTYIKVRSILDEESARFRRHCYCVASLELVGSGVLSATRPDQWMDAETFMIGLMTGFVATPERGELLLLLAGIRESSVREVLDNTVSQEVKTGRGIHMVGSTTVKNPWLLAPYRTFREITQPESAFILRLASAEGASRPRAALFEADGGAWKLDAIEAIKAYLNEMLPDTMIIG
jgi:hypothetical protein